MPITPAELLLKIVLTGTHTHYEAPGLIDDKRLEHLLLSGKQILYKSHQEAEVRQNLGFSGQIWTGLAKVLSFAVPVLEAHSFAPFIDPKDPYDAAHAIISSSDVIAHNYLSLIKDIERLNDLTTIARNLLATTRRAQNLAAEKGFDQQILKLIDVCVRVAARGYDGQAAKSIAAAGANNGTPGSSAPIDNVGGDRSRAKWQKVVNLYKRLLITCLQFLHNFIMHNEQRKLVLWLDLFGSSSLKATEREAQQREVGEVEEQISREAQMRINTQAQLIENGMHTDVEEPEVEAVDIPESSPEPQPAIPMPQDQYSQQDLTETGLGYNIDDVHALFDLMSAERVLDDTEKEKKRMLMDKIRTDLERMSGLTATQLDNNPDILLRAGAALREHLALRDFSARNAARMPAIPTRRSAAGKTTRMGTLPTLANYVNPANVAEQEITEDDLVMPRSAESAAETLQEAKDELMSRLTDDRSIVADGGWDVEVDEDGNILEAELEPELEGEEGGMLEEDVVDEGEEEYDDEDDDQDEFDSRRIGDQERGLLTDVPLVLGPTEIEALPMIIQAGIVENFGMKNQYRDTIERQGARNMQAVRCHILLAQEAGRNVLRELLIFIAAWDLPDDEFYFRMMVQIMEAILKNGLMSHAYSDFGQAKDIISPAQAVVIKILTHIFRTKYSPTHDERDEHDMPVRQNRRGQKLRIPAPISRVDLLTVRYIFTVFRGNIIPETCALIYLQGQILKVQAQARAQNQPSAFDPYGNGGEDFPLNLWDMERVYEGVYQFLEFFAVLTENNDWKRVLVRWEIVYDLVTLLGELEVGIPKAPLDLRSNQDLPVHGRAPPRSTERPGFRDQDKQRSSADQDPSTFEWRNLKKLIVLVLSSLVWRSRTVQDQIREYGGVPTILSCTVYDGHNPYIKEHAVMCLKFLLEGNAENQAIVRELEAQGVANNNQLQAQFGVTADVHGGKVRVEQRQRGQRSEAAEDLERAYHAALIRDEARARMGSPVQQHGRRASDSIATAAASISSIATAPMSTAEKLDAMRERFNRLDIASFTQGLPIRTQDAQRQRFGMRDVSIPTAEPIRTAHVHQQYQTQHPQPVSVDANDMFVEEGEASGDGLYIRELDDNEGQILAEQEDDGVQRYVEEEDDDKTEELSDTEIEMRMEEVRKSNKEIRERIAAAGGLDHVWDVGALI
ncbi:hypothetical protein LTR64_002168 [Lithohypha guttulata]|uniref:uncharacterized protein n=1 Tax=Lithohypha guttulata TaxID=1690604 RepID=UPI002DDFE0AF|nr:hypothetical protein LTR51_001605 [Lithohypha guttulata]